MHQIKTVGKSGQISLGKSLSGESFIVEELPGGDIMLKHAVVIPSNQQWLHAPEMKAKLARFNEWAAKTPASETNIAELEESMLCAS